MSENILLQKPIRFGRIILNFILFFILISYNSFSADFELTPQMQKAYSEILKMRIYSGRNLLLADKNQPNGFRAYLESYADMIELLASENPNDYDEFIDQQSDRLSFISSLDKSSPYNKLLQAEVRLHSAFVKLKFGHEIKGAGDIIKAYKLLEANAKQFPNFISNQKSLGLLHILIGSTPENYLWVAHILGLRGNINQGLTELQNVIQKDPFFRDEAQMIDYVVHSYILKINEKQLAGFKNFIESHPDNLLFQFFGITTYIKEGKSEEALDLLELKRKPGYVPLPVLEYLKSDILLQKGQYHQAVTGYLYYINNHKGLNFIKDANYKLFLCYWLNNEDTKAMPYLQKVEEVGETIVESDKSALKYSKNYLAKKPGPQSKILMKARLACDGGYYDQALSFLGNLTEAQFESLSDKAEFNYRKGRIYQRMDDSLKAVPLFERAINLSSGQNWSFGANAALQTGYIFQQKGDRMKAKYFFEKAISFKKHEYKNSVDNKAKAALNEMGF
ncbi:Tetratricopeptide repeat-containing protein [Pseudarcicella hirudinis]|uniref:Tetratricopeptide repeat-containing protein n=2 Tax=Pseudarcicella hirudinis TaxID=1079859 RepID=A0A1I5UHT1_9BACT|nr:hypothetical protein [Pseudarcicella hirudinis]SFP94835.1 Tetratricopeptide repeat-containing protein [Pseudarcicella hirudinis]